MKYEEIQQAAMDIFFSVMPPLKEDNSILTLWTLCKPF